MTIRTRFAPSPTGYLHIGGARTALFSWLYARKHGGQFILRIEDTDLERSTQESVNAILEGMTWLNLEYDEGPFYQTHRFDRYKEVIQQLVDTGHAYPCYCSKERLEKLREEQMEAKEKPKYDGHCRLEIVHLENCGLVDRTFRCIVIAHASSIGPIIASRVGVTATVAPDKDATASRSLHGATAPTPQRSPAYVHFQTPRRSAYWRRPI